MKIPRLPIWTWVLGGIALIVMVNVVAWVPRYSTSQSGFCISCHSTGETPDVSKPSKVHPDYAKVGCVDCHANPTDPPVIKEGYMGGYSAQPSRLNENCLRCHKDMVTNEQKGFIYNKYDIRIPHKFHLETAGAKCTDCHHNITHDFNPEPTNRPRMEYCFTCHQTAESRTCSKCHPDGLPKV